MHVVTNIKQILFHLFFIFLHEKVHFVFLFHYVFLMFHIQSLLHVNKGLQFFFIFFYDDSPLFHNVEWYGRYIDDIIAKWSGNLATVPNDMSYINNNSCNLYFTYNMDLKSVPFLDQKPRGWIPCDIPPSNGPLTFLLLLRAQHLRRHIVCQLLESSFSQLHPHAICVKTMKDHFWCYMLIKKPVPLHIGGFCKLLKCDIGPIGVFSSNSACQKWFFCVCILSDFS